MAEYPDSDWDWVERQEAPDPPPPNRPSELLIHSDPQAFYTWAEQRAEVTNANIDGVLAEYWTFHVLRQLQNTNTLIAFKGGRTLSLAFKLSTRVSMDIDLAIQTRMVDMSGVELFQVSSSHSSLGKPAEKEARTDLFSAAVNTFRRVLSGIRVDVRDLLHSKEDTLHRNRKLQLVPDMAGVHPYVPEELLDLWNVTLLVDIVLEFPSSTVLVDLPNPMDGQPPLRVQCASLQDILLDKVSAFIQRQHCDPSTYIRHLYDAACILLNPQSFAVSADFVGLYRYKRDQKEIVDIVESLAMFDPSAVSSAIRNQQSQAFRALDILGLPIATYDESMDQVYNFLKKLKQEASIS